jgi:hypothetical protein
MCLSLAWSGNVILARLVVRTTPSKKFRTRAHVNARRNTTRLASSPSGSRLAQLAFPGNPLMLFICAFDAVFIFAAVVRELFNHFIDAAGHIAIDCRLERSHRYGIYAKAWTFRSLHRAAVQAPVAKRPDPPQRRRAGGFRPIMGPPTGPGLVTNVMREGRRWRPTAQRSGFAAGSREP